ncbi:hypothetical protein K7432_014676, partial [Basidiobolus ranarum]
MRKLDQTVSEPYHTYTHEDVLSKLKTDVQVGMTTAEAKSRFESYGPNEMTGQGGPSAFRVLFRQIANALTLVLIIAMAIAFSAGGNYGEGAVIALVIVTNSTIGFFQEYKAEKTLESLRKMASPTCRVLRDGHLLTVQTRELVPGDILAFENGDIIGADCRLIEVSNLECDEALLTGETVPVQKNLDLIEDPDEPIGDRLNLVYSSTSVTRGRGKGVVIGTGMTTEIGKIAQELANSENKPGKTPLQKSLDRMAYLLFALAIVFILIVFGVNKFHINQSIAVYAISIGIAIIPGGLIAVVTFTMAIGVRKMAKER